jgi:hypothetical protein
MSSAKKGSPERLRPMTMKPIRDWASVRGSAGPRERPSCGGGGQEVARLVANGFLAHEDRGWRWRRRTKGEVAGKASEDDRGARHRRTAAP